MIDLGSESTSHTNPFRVGFHCLFRPCHNSGIYVDHNNLRVETRASRPTVIREHHTNTSTRPSDHGCHPLISQPGVLKQKPPRLSMSVSAAAVRATVKALRDDSPVDGADAGTSKAVKTILNSRKCWRNMKGKEEAVWPPELEAALIEGNVQAR